MITKLVTFVLIIFCAIIVLTDARRITGSSRGSFFSRSKPSSSSHTYSSSSSHSKPSHTISSTSHGNIGHGSVTYNSRNRVPLTPQNHVATFAKPYYPTQHQTHVQNNANSHHAPINPRLPNSGQHAPSAPHLPSAPPASHMGRIQPKHTVGSSSSSSGYGLNQNGNSGYGTSSHSNHEWTPSQTVPANKNWQTSSQSNPHNYGGVSNANYPRQQYHPAQSNSYGTSYHPQPNQPHVVNNFITTNNHQPHYVNPGVSSFSTPSVGYHFVTYRNYPTYYSPFPSYSPVSSFGLGLAVGSSLGHNHHYHGYPSNTHHYYHHYDSNNNNGNGGGGGGNSNANNNGNGNSNTANGNNPNSHNSGQNGNTNPNNLNGNSNQNVQPNQNGTIQDPTQPMAPLVYSMQGQTSNDDADSTEMVFTNPYLIVGVENMLMYGEFQDEQDILIIIEQEADGLDPYPWDPMYSLWHPNATSVQMTVSNDSRTTTNTEINATPTTTIKTDTQSASTSIPKSTNNMQTVPLAPLPVR